MPQAPATPQAPLPGSAGLRGVRQPGVAGGGRGRRARSPVPEETAGPQACGWEPSTVRPAEPAAAGTPTVHREDESWSVAGEVRAPLRERTPVVRPCRPDPARPTTPAQGPQSGCSPASGPACGSLPGTGIQPGRTVSGKRITRVPRHMQTEWRDCTSTLAAFQLLPPGSGRIRRTSKQPGFQLGCVTTSGMLEYSSD